ncbi:UNVERIFIED_CONTAM: IclR family transcriptional regulator [Mumia flava]
MDAAAPAGTITAVERAADVLLQLAASSEADLGVTEIASALSLPKAAVHRILASLRSRDLVVLDEQTRRYALGPAAVRLGVVSLERIDIRRTARPLLKELSERTGETATLSVLHGTDSRMYVEQVTPDREVMMTVSLAVPYPLHAGASSRALLAFLPEERRGAYLSSGPLRAVTGATLVDPDELRTDLAAIHDQGWAHSRGERLDGAASVASPVLGHDGLPLAVVSVCGPAERFESEVDACREVLLEVTRRLSHAAGWTG